MPVETGAGPNEIEEAKRRGYQRGLNLGLYWVALPCSLFSAGRSFYDVAAHFEVFRQVRVPIPGLTLLVIDYHYYVAGALLLGAAGCGYATRAWAHERRTTYLNGAMIFLSLGWLALFTLALQAPMMLILQGLGQHR